MKVIIMMGLPGSGKTTLANELKVEKANRIRIIDFDRCLKVDKSKALSLLSNLYRNFGGYLTNGNYVIDGLIHTNEQLSNVIKEVVKNDGLKEIEIYYWRENREQCLINDNGKREVFSKISIKDLQFDVPNIRELRTLLACTNVKIDIKYHDVPIKPDWLVFSDKYGLGCNIKDPYFKSDSWSTGGSYGNCWDNSKWEISPDKPLEEFKEFDELIDLIVDDISKKKYKRLYKKSVSIGTSHESDYYGGRGSNYAFYQCNVKDLYSELVDMELLVEQEETNDKTAS